MINSNLKFKKKDYVFVEGISVNRMVKKRNINASPAQQPFDHTTETAD